MGVTTHESDAQWIHCRQRELDQLKAQLDKANMEVNSLIGRVHSLDQDIRNRRAGLQSVCPHEKQVWSTCMLCGART